LTWREYAREQNEKIDFPFDQLFSLIPSTIPSQFLQHSKDFTRDRQLSFPQLVTFILSSATSDKNTGLNIKAGDFAKQARRSGLFPDLQAASAGAISKARAKVPWEAFQNIFHDAVDLARPLWDEQPRHRWHNMSVYAIDGSKYTLPASNALREEFDPMSGFHNPGKGHYPQCLVSTAYDVFKRHPITLGIAPCNTSEREEAKLLLPHIPDNGVILFDRGYPSYEFILTLLSLYQGNFVLRCPASSTFPAVKKFVQSKKKQALIYIQPSQTYLSECTKEQKENAKPILLRVLRLVSPDGTTSVLLTNLTDKSTIPVQDIIDLYFERYRIEEHYRNEKIILEIEKFHSKCPNGIRQEIYAAAILSTIARLLINLTDQSSENGRIEPQFKNAVLALSADAFVLIPQDPHQSLQIFKELLEQIAQVKYYRPLKKRPAQPRVCKKPPNKWCEGRAEILAKTGGLPSC
jgi:hypothetical protein